MNSAVISARSIAVRITFIKKILVAFSAVDPAETLLYDGE
jgi:hypothetical protein